MQIMRTYTYHEKSLHVLPQPEAKDAQSTREINHFAKKSTAKEKTCTFPKGVHQVTAPDD